MQDQKNHINVMIWGGKNLTLEVDKNMAIICLEEREYHKTLVKEKDQDLANLAVQKLSEYYKMPISKEPVDLENLTIEMPGAVYITNGKHSRVISVDKLNSIINMDIEK